MVTAFVTGGYVVWLATANRPAAVSSQPSATLTTPPPTAPLDTVAVAGANSSITEMATPTTGAPNVQDFGSPPQFPISDVVRNSPGPNVQDFGSPPQFPISDVVRTSPAPNIRDFRSNLEDC